MMEITLNHTIIPSHDNVKSAKFYERIFGFEFVKEWGYFAVVKANSTLTLDFMNKEKFTTNHYAFKVSEMQFDEIFLNVLRKKISSLVAAPTLQTTERSIMIMVGVMSTLKIPAITCWKSITKDYVID